MKKMITLSFILMLGSALLLSGCSGGDGSGGPLGVGGLIGDSQKDPGWLEGAQDYAFAEDSTHTFEKEREGYSCEVTIKTWKGRQSANEELVFHPANNQLAIPLGTNTDAVVPFMATVKTTTQNAQFVTDIHMIFRSGTSANGNMTTNCYIADTAAIESGRVRYIDYKEYIPVYNWNNFWGGQGGWFSAEKTETGDEQVLYGYYIIPDHYGPAYPDGNPDTSPEALTLLVNVAFNPNNLLELNQQDDGNYRYPGDVAIDLHIEA